MVKKLSTAEWQKRIDAAFGKGKYTIKHLEKGPRAKAVVQCSKHGRFNGSLSALSKGNCSCPECQQEKCRATKHAKYFKRIEEALNTKFKGRIKYIRGFNGSKSLCTLSCRKHGRFETYGHSILQYKHLCPKCSKSGTHSPKRLRAKALFERRTLDYPEFIFGKYSGHGTKIPVHCKKHSVDFQIPHSALTQRTEFVGCSECLREYRQKIFTKSRSQVSAELQAKHAGSIVLLGDYRGTRERHSFRCLTCGYRWETIPDSLTRTKASGCPNCATDVCVSKSEQRLFDWVVKLFPDAEQSVRRIYREGAKNALEWDIHIPSKKFAIEYNGLYFHSYPLKPKAYHWEKTRLSREAGVKLVHVYEDDWRLRPRVVKKTLRHLLGCTELRYYARELELRSEASLSKATSKFYTNNHMLGPPTRGITYGLTTGGKLIAAMTFSPIQSSRGVEHVPGVYELTRFATKAQVVGAASRLFTAFVRDFNPTKVVSYSDHDMFDGGMYRLLGFTAIAEVKYDYTTVWGGRRRHKSYTRRANLEKLLGANFDPNKSEMQNLVDNNIKIIFNSGRTKWEWVR